MTQTPQGWSKQVFAVSFDLSNSALLLDIAPCVLQPSVAIPDPHFSSAQDLSGKHY